MDKATVRFLNLLTDIDKGELRLGLSLEVAKGDPPNIAEALKEFHLYKSLVDPEDMEE